MNNITIINAVKLSKYAYKDLGNGLNSLQIVNEYSKTLPDSKKTVWLTDDKSALKKDLNNNNNIIYKELWDIKELLKSIKELSADFDNIFYIYTDCPCLDKEISYKMYSNHIKYFADYTFADGYPYGITPEIINKNIINNLMQLALNNTESIKRDTIFEIIKKDINSFDIETEISPKDMRLLRIDLCTDKKRNYMLLKDIIKNKSIDSKSILNLLENKQEILRTLPAFFNIQIVEGCPQNCSYCPYPEMRDNKTGKLNEMPLDDYKKIIEQISDFSEDGTVSLSLWGEPSYHSNIYEIINYVLIHDNLDLIIETSGLGWQENTFIQIKNSLKKQPYWIVSLDAWSREQYSMLRGDGYEEAYGAVNTLINYFPGRVYVQAVRMKKNEDDLEAFYRNWKAKLETIIIQKYDHFCGALPDQRVTDLSPLKRIPCWHIKRDINILLNGEVRLCREDIKGGNVIGNVFTDGLKKIWENNNLFYIKHLDGDLPEICKNCDEYYTYNF